MQYKNLIHLYNRFGFGLSGSELRRYSRLSFEQALKQEKVQELRINLSELRNVKRKDLSDMQRKELRKKSKEKLMELNVEWMQQMISSTSIIQQKMSFFWHHHFACIIGNPIFAQNFTNGIRKHATGNFRDLLLEVSKSAAMINFLNTRQNRKRSPNEDFARELCELFTLGRDQEYTENDVQEIARCFTGWNYKANGEFFFNLKQHDQGKKTVFGKSGNFDGEDIIDLILEKKACARFICDNIYRYFVNPVADKRQIEELTEVFYSSNYDIKKLIIHIANSDWFYEEKNILARIKSPMEFFVGLGRQFKLTNEKPKSWLTLQRIFDQVLYQPPNVKGWKENQEWIDSNSLPLRLRIPSIILTNSALEINSKPDYDSNPNDMADRNKLSRKLDFGHDWGYFFRQNEGMDFKELFFNNKISPQVATFLQNNKFDSQMEEVIQLISLPEYQLN